MRRLFDWGKLRRPMRESNSSLINDVYTPMKLELMRMNGHMRRIYREIYSDIRNKKIPLLARRIEYLSILNMTEYHTAGVNKRHTIIEEAFKILEFFTGFKWNPRGSFMFDGAFDAFKKDVKILITGNKLSINIGGRLEKLEKGESNWNNLRRFFYNPSVRKAIEYVHSSPDTFYNNLNALFKTKKDPTEPRGRPYVSKAIKDSSVWFDVYMLDTIANTLRQGDKWVKGNPQGGHRV